MQIQFVVDGGVRDRDDFRDVSQLHGQHQVKLMRGYPVSTVLVTI